MAKKIIIIHGRSTKPRQNVKERLVKESIIHGLRRVSNSYAAKVENGQIPVLLAYYGDINNAILWGHKRKPRKKFQEDFLTKWKYPYEADDSYNEDLKKLFLVGNQTKSEYRKLKKQSKDFGYFEEVAGIISPFTWALGLNDNVLNRFLPDLHAYFKYRIVGSMIRQRLQAHLVPALRSADDVCLISHSLGTCVAYDVAWKVSRMSEYSDIHDKKVNLFITMGSPLGEPGIKSQLYDCDEPDDGKYPRNIVEWHNFSAEDDFISHDEELEDDFSEMKDRKLIKKIVDHYIYNFWTSSENRLNPHKLYAYLDNEQLCKVIGKWME